MADDNPLLNSLQRATSGKASSSGGGVAVADDDEENPLIASLKKTVSAPSPDQSTLTTGTNGKVGTPDVVAAYANKNGVSIGAARQALRAQGYELRNYLPNEVPQKFSTSALPEPTPFSASIPTTPPTAIGAAAGSPMINLAPPQTPQTFDASQIPRSPFTNQFEGIRQTPEQVRVQNATEDTARQKTLTEQLQDAAFGLTPEQVKEHDAGVDKLNERVESLARKVPVPAFTEPGATNPYPFGIRASSVGELTDLSNEYLNDPRQPKTRAEAFAAGTAADTVKMMLSPINLLSAGMGGVEAGALSKAGDLATDAVKLAQDYDAMRQAGASGAELAEMEGKMSKAVEAAARAQKALILAKKAGTAAAVGFGAQGGGGIAQGIADKSLPEVAGGLGQVILGGAAAHGATDAGGIEEQVKGATREAVRENLKGQGDVTAQRTQQVPTEAQQVPAAPQLGENTPTVGAGEKIVPEKPETLTAQTDALAKGTNKVVYFPKGTETLPAPPENAKVTVVAGDKPGAGTYYHDASITPAQIKSAVKDGTYGQLLGHVQSKEEATVQGSQPVGVVARDEAGNELKASVVDANKPNAVEAQKFTLAKQFPEAKIAVESPERVITARQGEMPRAETLATQSAASAQTPASEVKSNLTDQERRALGPFMEQHAREMAQLGPKAEAGDAAAQEQIREKLQGRRKTNVGPPEGQPERRADQVEHAENVQALTEHVSSIKSRVAAGKEIPLDEIANLHTLADHIESQNVRVAEEPVRAKEPSGTEKPEAAKESEVVPNGEPAASAGRVSESGKGIETKGSARSEGTETGKPAKGAVSPERAEPKGLESKGGTPSTPKEEAAAGMRDDTTTPAKRTRKISNGALIREAYRPGNIVRSYGGAFDKVISFTPGDESKPYPHNTWQVKVIHADKEGNPIKGELERTHHTAPEREDIEAARKRLEERAPLAANQGDRVQIIDGKLKGKIGEVTRATDEGGVYVRTEGGSRAQYVKDGDFEFAKPEEKPAERPKLSSTTAYSNPLFDPELWKGVLGYLKPSEAAGNANLRERTGGLARAQAVLQEKLRAEHNRWRGRSDSDMLAFADLVEGGEADRAARGVTLKSKTQQMLDAGKKHLNTQDKNLAATLRTLLDEGRTAVQNLGTGKLQNFIENYFPHMWEQKGSKVGQTIGQVFGKKPLEGPKSFLKQRTIPTTAEGFDKDLKPVTTNPVDLAVLKMHEMNRYVMAHRLLDDLKAAGSAKFVGFGEKAPDGWKPLDDKVFQVLQWSEADKGMINRGRYYAPEEIAQPINRYVGQGLRGVPIYDIIRSFGNTLNQLQLGLSGFHLGTTSLNAVISQFSLGAKQLAHGQLLSAAKNLIAAPAAPIRNLIQGGGVLKDYLRPDQAKKYAATANAVEQAGGRSGMGEEYIDNRIERMMQSFANKKWFKGALQAIPAAVEMQAIPVLKWVVPRMKLGAFHDLATDILERGQKKGWTQDKIRSELQKSWDSIDNRFGQVVYDNLNWNKVAKDLAFIGVRSVGWNYGTWRELGGGVKDAAAQAGQALNGKGFDVTDRMAYTFALPLTIAALGALYMLAHTGKWPQGAKDYFYPKNGKLEDDGTEARSSLPSYMKDVFSMSEHPVDTALHKLNPAIGLIVEMIENKDYYGNEIRNSDDPAVAQLGQALKHVGESFLPFTFRNQVQRSKIGEKGAESIAENVLGLTPAPRNVERSDAEALAHDLIQRRSPAGAHTTTEQQKQDRIFDLEQTLRTKPWDEARETAKQKLESGEMTEDEVKSALRRSQTPGLVRAFKELTIPEALKVWEVATPKEQKELKDILEAKVQNGFLKLTREDQDRYRPLLRDALLGGSSRPPVVGIPMRPSFQQQAMQ
jgi:hypothetical protein